MTAAPALGWDSRVSRMDGPLPQWSYTGARGPEAWAELSSSFERCAEGRAQSPVPLETRRAVPEPCVPLRFRYRSSALEVINDGNALRLNYDRGSYLMVAGLSYELVELRFHVPGEHAIDGRVPDAEIELLHGNNRGDLVILSVPVEAGRRLNQTLRRILEHAPETAGRKAYGRNIGVNALFLLPPRKSYLSYRGSLTRPPCQEGVRWYVFDHPLEVEARDLAPLAQLVAANARPLQPLNGRRVSRFCAAGGSS